MKGNLLNIIGIVLILLAGLAVASPDGDDLSYEAKAQTFIELFFAGDDDAYRDRLSPEMTAAMTAATADQIRSQMTGAYGEVVRVEAAWFEDAPGTFTRYRVPVVFTEETVDARVVIDEQGLISGFFQTPHVPSPAQREADPTLAGSDSPEVAGHWEGVIDLPGQTLTVFVDLVFNDGYWVGTIDIPGQGAAGLPLEHVGVDGAEATFTISGVPGDPVFKGTVASGEMTGTFTQNGVGMPFRLSRKTAEGPPRPQEPRPPFPYQSEDVTCHNGQIELAGTLTLPYAPGPCAAVLLISGSGPQDRNEEILGHKPFLVLADHLTRAGVAVLRLDDRGVGESTGSRSNATTEDYAEDALAAIAYLAQRPEIDPQRIGAVGHSEGGMIAPILANRSEQVAFIVLLGGTGVPGDEIIMRQIELMNRSAGLPEDRIAAALEAQREIFSMVRRRVSEEDLCARMLEVMKDQAPGTPEEQLVDKARDDARSIMSPWYRHFLDYDPRVVLRRVKVPVLAICGEKDLQVDPKQSLPEIATALDEAGNEDVTVWEMPGLNHLFQTAGTGSLSEYYMIEETFAPAALEMISDWILSRF